MRPIYTLLLICFFSTQLFAQPGSLDASFAQNGIYTVPGAHSEPLASVAVDNQGRIYIAGSFGGNLHVSRLSASGALDATFGASGIAIVNYALSAAVEDILIQPDGKILLAGSVGLLKDADPIVVRLNSDGRLDRTFAGNGTFRFQVLNNFDRAREIGLLSDGSVIALFGVGAQGSSAPSDANYENLGLLKLSSSGIQDQTFAGTGYWHTNWFTNAWDRSPDLLIQSDDKIVIPATVSQMGQGERVHVFRFMPNGNLDTLSFGVFPGESAWHYLNGDLRAITSGIGIQSSGKFLVAGTYGGFVRPNTDFFVMRFNTDGKPDSTFNQFSVVVTDFFGDDETCHDLVMQGNDFILVGEADSAGTKGMAMARYLHDGRLDSTFGTNGLAFFANKGIQTEAALLANGKIISAGVSGTSIVVSAVQNHATSGLENLTTILELSVSPNPFNEYLNISFDLDKGQSLNLDLVDMTGKLISRQFSQRKFSEGKHSLELEAPGEMGSGLYLLHLYGASTKGIRTIIHVSP